MIYYAEDDRSIRELVIYTLRNTGFKAEGFENGTDLINAVKNKKPELVLLDIMLPDEDGISILRTIRSDISTAALPVIMVTAKGTEYDRITGLDCGADDYITKPFGIMEMISRIKAVLRRTRNSNSNDDCLVYKNIKINRTMHIVTVNDIPVELTLKEYELLSALIKNKGAVLTRDKLLEKIWGYDFDGETRTVDVHIRTLRSKLGESGDVIETVRGVGYRIGGVK